MKVLATADSTGSGHYRMREPVRVLAGRGEVDARVADTLPIEFKGREVIDVHGVGGVDLVHLQRPMHWFMPAVIDLLHTKGIAVSVDMDDDMHSILPMQTGFGESSPTRSPASNTRWLRESIKKADLITCSTEALASRYGSRGNAVVLRNAVAESWLGVPRKRAERIRVGWGGSARNHPTDLQVTHGGVGAACRATGARFLCVGGAGAGQMLIEQALDLRGVELEFTDWAPLADLDGSTSLYPYLVARIDVGIVPLATVKFNEAKSWLKGLEYAALGVPFVASALPEYQRLATMGIGRLAADRSRSWKRAVEELAADDEAGEAARTFCEDLTIERNAWRWAEAWALAVQRFKGVNCGVP